ncbi:hypothetical protein [Streptomyces sp. YIM 98790]|uniref:hypothetical protein n=1 Tax=Streptomyces sp. YIM 98790 TaxID=2689077 RepID=UPI001FB635A6|nr:hypothetical protein [Streptomyces sp. YIM 98790]
MNSEGESRTGVSTQTRQSVSMFWVRIDARMSVVRATDSDFRVCQIGFDALLEIQREAEERGWATRWTSVDALRSQVKEGSVVLQSLMREERGGVVRAYRCLLLFSTVGDEGAGGVAAIDIDPARYESLERLDRDSDVRKALARMFSLAMGGISMVAKK